MFSSNRHNSHSQTALATLVNCMIERGELAEAEGIFGDVRSAPASTPAIDAYVLLAARTTALAAQRY